MQPSQEQLWQIDAAEKNLDRLLEWISRHDTKASIIIGLNTGMLGALASFSSSPASWACVQWVVVCGTLVLIGLSAWFAWHGMFPRVAGPKKSLLYFNSIALLTCDAFQKGHKAQTPSGYLDDLTEQIHKNATILETKFSSLQTAYYCFIPSIIPWAIALCWFKAQSPTI